MSNTNFPQQSSSAPKSSSFNSKMELLKNEMFKLRQLDLSLLQQLYKLNESINEYRILMHEQEENSPPILSFSNSEDNSDEDKASYVSGVSGGGSGVTNLKPQKIPRDDERNNMIDAMHEKLELMFLNPSSAS